MKKNIHILVIMENFGVKNLSVFIKSLLIALFPHFVKGFLAKVKTAAVFGPAFKQTIYNFGL